MISSDYGVQKTLLHTTLPTGGSTSRAPGLVAAAFTPILSENSMVFFRTVIVLYGAYPPYA